jgi:hypothetical protein
MTTQGTNEVLYLVRESAFIAIVEQRESLMRAMSDLDSIRDETESTTLKLAMDGPLNRIGVAIRTLIEATKRE